MILYQEALEIVRAQAKRRSLKVESQALESTLLQISATEVRSPSSNPPFDNSSMDGFAVCAEDVALASPENPVLLKGRGKMIAGDSARLESHDKNTAIEIMTGAPMPSGRIDSVIKIEDVQVFRDTDGSALQIKITKPIEKGNSVRYEGEDFKRGDVVINASETVQLPHLLAAATLGITTLDVLKKPRVAIISTGKELASPQTHDLKPGQIRNSTGLYLKETLSQIYHCDVIHTTTVGDDETVFCEELKNVFEMGVDFVITTGAVSMGSEDYIPRVIEKCGGKIRFHSCALRPGKPNLLATFGGTGPVLFGAPGNPLSTVVALRFFVDPYLRALRRQEDEQPLEVILKNDTPKPEGLRCFFKGLLTIEDGVAKVESHAGQPSFMVRPLLESNAWVILEEGLSHVAAGTKVKVQPLFPGAFI